MTTALVSQAFTVHQVQKCQVFHVHSVIPVTPYEKAVIAIPNLQVQKLRLG